MDSIDFLEDSIELLKDPIDSLRIPLISSRSLLIPFISLRIPLISLRIPLIPLRGPLILGGVVLMDSYFQDNHWRSKYVSATVIVFRFSKLDASIIVGMLRHRMVVGNRSTSQL